MGPRRFTTGAPPVNRTIFGSASNLFAMFASKGQTIRGRGRKKVKACTFRVRPTQLLKGRMGSAPRRNTDSDSYPGQQIIAFTT